MANMTDINPDVCLICCDHLGYSAQHHDTCEHGSGEVEIDHPNHGKIKVCEECAEVFEWEQAAKECEPQRVLHLDGEHYLYDDVVAQVKCRKGKAELMKKFDDFQTKLSNL